MKFVRLLYVVIVSCFLGEWAFAQDCPQTSPSGQDLPARSQALSGKLVFHDGLRQWFELKLDRAQCGQQSFQLVRGQRSWAPLQVFRGCQVVSRGSIDWSATGYYSLDMYQDVESVQPVGSCMQQAAFPDYSKLKPAEQVRQYRVEMNVNYEPGDHPIRFRVTSKGKEVSPWQAYATYNLTGGLVLYGQCGKGFVVDKVFGSPRANPAHFDVPRTPSDMAAFDPESAASAGEKHLRLSYTCVRGR